MGKKLTQRCPTNNLSLIVGSGSQNFFFSIVNFFVFQLKVLNDIRKIKKKLCKYLN